MEEKNDFDKLFGSNLPNFADKDWRNLEGQLDRHDLKKQFTRLLWALPALGGILMTISGILYYQLNQTRQQVRTLENRLVRVFENKKKETDFSPQKIIIYDTIYTPRVIRETLKEIENQHLVNNPNNHYYLKYEDNFTENQGVTEREKYIGIFKLLGKNPVLKDNNLAINHNLSAYQVIQFPDDSLVAENHFSFIPKSFTVGALVGIQKPFGNNFERGEGKDIGISTVLGYHNRKGQERWGVVLDVRNSTLSFDFNKRDGDEHFPAPKNPRPSGKMPNRLEIPKLSITKIGIGGRYQLLFSEKMKPYFGASWHIQLPTFFDADYHFDDQPRQDETRSQEGITHFVGLNAGINVMVAKHLALTGELNYQTPLRLEHNMSDDLATPNILGARVGLSYRFGN